MSDIQGFKICKGHDATQLDESLSGHKFHCGKCDVHLTSLGLCPKCGERYELPDPKIADMFQELMLRNLDDGKTR